MAAVPAGTRLLGAQFTALTYLAPYLERVTGISGSSVSAFLLAFGITAAVGAFTGGRYADRDAATALIVANLVLVVALGGLYLTGANPVLAALALALWGLVGFGLGPRCNSG